MSAPWKRAIAIALLAVGASSLLAVPAGAAPPELPPPSIQPSGSPWSGTLTDSEEWSNSDGSHWLLTGAAGWYCTGSRTQRFTTIGDGEEQVRGVGSMPIRVEVSVEDSCHKEYYTDDNGTTSPPRICRMTMSGSASGSADLSMSEASISVNYFPIEGQPDQGNWGFQAATYGWVPSGPISFSDPCGQSGESAHTRPTVGGWGDDPNPWGSLDAVATGTRLAGSHTERTAVSHDQGDSTWTHSSSWDFVYTGAPEVPHMGSTCGRTRFRWFTVAGRPSFIGGNEQTCTLLLSNGLAQEALSIAYGQDMSLTEVFGGEMSGLLAREFAEDAAQQELQSRGWDVAARIFPKAANFMKATNFYLFAGDIAGYNAVALHTFFVINQIQNKGACIQVNLDIDSGVLKVDWHLVYNPSALRDPVADRELTIASLWDREERRLRPDLFHRKKLNLSCTGQGLVEVKGPGARDTAQVFERAVTGAIVDV